MRSIVRPTAKLSSRWLKLGFRKAKFRASAFRHDSISSKNDESISEVPLFLLLDSTYLSNEPLRTESRE